MPMGAATVKPARWRSSSLSPAQKPYSWLLRANCRHWSTTGHWLQSWRARASRRARAWGRSALGGKKRGVRPLHAARSVQCSESFAATGAGMWIIFISLSDIVSAFSVWGDRVSPHYEGARGNCKYLVLNVPTSTSSTKEASIADSLRHVERAESRNILKCSFPKGVGNAWRYLVNG